MRVGSFSLLIPEGCERDSGHVELPHGQVYQLRLGNHGHRRCDADVSIDGKPVGCFRLDAGRTVTLERSADDNGRFTFFKTDTTEAGQAGVASIDRDNRGLVQVIFRPERVREVVVRGGPCGQSVKGAMGGQHTNSTRSRSYGEENTLGLCSAGPASAGITGLTGHSDQSFRTVANLTYDPDGTVTITLRLVVGVGVRELTPVSRGNPVPSAVE